MNLVFSIFCLQEKSDHRFALTHGDQLHQIVWNENMHSVRHS